MSIDIRYPNITARSEKDQLVQLKGYLYQLVDQLQFALNNVGTASSTVVQVATRTAPSTGSASVDPTTTFNAIKSLIIKSADIVDAYYQEINSRLTGVYVAESDFGTFAENTEQYISQSSTDIDQLFTNTQAIFTDIANLNFTLAEVNAHIRSGLLDYDESGVPIYGLEIGQKNEVDGTEVFNKFARFTADRLSFYDQNGSELAYVSDYKLYINNIQVRGSLQVGGYKDFVDSAGGIVTKWVGGV